MGKRNFIPKWLRPPAATPDGVMSLADHLREVRYRLIISLAAVILAAVVSAIWYEQLYQLLLLPYLRAVQLLAESDPNLHPSTVISGVVTPFTLALKTCATAGLAVASPVWIYQLWKFVVPALLAKEKRYLTIFLAVAIPLFLAGVAVGYYIMPQGISVMLSFTPSSVPVTNLLEINQFLSLMLQLMLIFGLGFLMPVVVVGLNLLGVVSAKRLGKVRTYVIFGIFVFAAVATPSTDPFSMLALSVPMVLLYLIAEIIARVHDRRAKRTQSA
ncbi:MAG: twin-arginine translocase subunit TatC [Propionibacteriaceae bacterium]|jgi:sec-independent protein translocase protein TatC|nr:twin-arginine translocase subunit TatC [Propionibacteriaceae bacterium]